MIVAQDSPLLDKGLSCACAAGGAGLERRFDAW